MHPDITFDSLLISRKHCCIEQRGEGWSICELKSKHGTLLNGEPLPQSLSVPLKHGDKIGLAANIVSLRFSLTPELDQTLDYNCADPLPGATVPQPAVPWSSTPRKSPCWSAARKLRCRRRNGSCRTVYKHRNELVTYDSIRMTVWAERVSSAGRPPEVGVEEINLLLYRLRRKLGAGANILKPAAAGAASWKSARRQYCFRRLSLCNETVIRPLYFFRPAIAKIKARKTIRRNA